MKIRAASLVTYTEVLSHLIEENLRYENNGDGGNAEQRAVVRALRQIRGTYGLAVVFKSKPDRIVIARNSSPLVIGVGRGENIVASDASAIVGRTREVIYLNNGEGAVLTKDRIKPFSISGFHSLKTIKGKTLGFKNLNISNISKKKEKLNWSVDDAQKGGFSLFMIEEIFDQPESISVGLAGRFIKNDGLAKLGGSE